MTANLKSQAYNHIRKQMMQPGIAEGGLLSPRQIAKSIGMSYTPVREAIIQLETEGLLEKVGNRGVRVRNPSPEELLPIFELRLVMETGAAELAAEKITGPEFVRLKQNIQKHLTVLKNLRNQGRRGEISETFYNQIDDELLMLNFEFHLTILNATHNAQIIKNTGDLRILTRSVGMRIHFPGQDYMDQYVRDFRYHVRIYRAIARRDADAAREWVRKHLKNAIQYSLAIHRAIQGTLSGERQNKFFYPETLLESMQTIENRLAKPPRSES